MTHLHFTKNDIKLNAIQCKRPESKTYINDTWSCSFFFLVGSEKEIITRYKIYTLVDQYWSHIGCLFHKTFKWKGKHFHVSTIQIVIRIFDMS